MAQKNVLTGKSERAVSGFLLFSLRKPVLTRKKLLHCAQEAAKNKKSDLSPAAVWLTDNARYLAETITSVRRDADAAGFFAGSDKCARIEQTAKALAQDELSKENIIARLQLCQRAEAFTLGELRAFPIALRTALLDQIAQILTQIQAENAKTQTELRAALAEKTNTGAQIAKAVLSLRLLDDIAWSKVIPAVSETYRVLSQDETFVKMDDESRALYAEKAAQIAEKYKKTEAETARAVLALAEGNDNERGEAGYYLLENTAPLIEKLTGKKRKARKKTSVLYALYAVPVLFLVLGILLLMPVYIWPSMMFMGAALARTLLRLFCARFLSPRRLPRLGEKALDKDARALVVVPTLITGKEQALRQVRNLAMLHDANPDKRLDFMLLCDFPDSNTQTRPAEDMTMRLCAQAVRALRDDRDANFYYVQRGREFSESEHRYMGHERKRGALMMLNRLIAGEQVNDLILYSDAPTASFAHRWRYCVTLDADTQTPPGSIMKLLLTMEHPLQKGRVRVLQPRMETAAETVKTRAQLFLGGRGGVETYNTAAQEVWQDLFGRGSYCGKGLYEPLEFLRLTRNLPNGKILSHDLIEGELARSALVCDVTFYDGHPSTVSGFITRLDRWTRGDFQLLPFVKTDKLDLLSRHKILDNIVRALTPLFQLVLLLYAVYHGNYLYLFIALLPVIPMPLPRALTALCILPAKACICLSAGLRALWRMNVSHTGLLKWVTAAQTEKTAAPPLPPLIFSLLSGAMMSALSFEQMQMWFISMPLGLLWTVAPLAAGFLDKPFRASRLSKKDKQFLTRSARATWAFFEETVTEEGNFLPPDNVQLSPERGIAWRTSPTNIGMYLLSCVAARFLSFIDSDEMARRMEKTISVLEKMKKEKGQLFNWYDIKTLDVLQPAYISSVDSGNLYACLLCCAQAARAFAHETDAALRSLPARMDTLCESMDFSFLYDKEKKLFFIGCERGQKPSGAHYDLLAGEARLLSFAAVMTGKVPVAHFYALSRRLTRAYGANALYSWGGTMFEYLMADLLLPAYRGTLLHASHRAVVRAQRLSKPFTPWGVSESGFHAFDGALNYQYRAFGLPALALSGEASDKTIAPYASALALCVSPRSAARNLLRMRKSGYAGEMGFYEAIDFSEKKPMIVYSHMAHHQGMLLCAVCNALTGGALVKTFCALPKARAHLLLLQEKMPKHIRVSPAPPVITPRGEDSVLMHRNSREGIPQDAALLHAEDTTLFLTARGQGFLQYRDLMLTRFLPDPALSQGIQIYVKDADTGAVTRMTGDGSAIFSTGAAQYQKDCDDLSLLLTCHAAPITGACVFHLHIKNNLSKPRTLEAVSFLEPALGRQAADEAHHAFRNLFVRVDALSSTALCAKRRARDESDKAPVLLHFLRTAEAPSDVFLQGDRRAFLGRAGSMARPEALEKDMSACSSHLGDVIDPCLSLRAKILLRANGETDVFFITAACEDKIACQALLLRYKSVFSLRDALSLSVTQAKVTGSLLHMDEKLQAIAGRLTGALLLRGQREKDMMPRYGIHALWAAGLSGDLPLVLCTMDEHAEDKTVNDLLRVFAFWRLCGIHADTVFIGANAGSVRDLALYESAHATVLESPNDETVNALHVFARVVVDASRGLKAQLEEQHFSLPDTPPMYPQTKFGEVTLPRLDAWNTLGGFSEDDSYIIRLKNGALPPAPWCNILPSERFGTIVSEQGIMSSYFDNSRLNRVTAYTNDSVNPRTAEDIYLSASGRICPLTPMNARGEYAVSHEAGVTVYALAPEPLTCETSVFTDPETDTGARLIHIKNTGGEQIAVTVFFGARFLMGERGEFTACETDGKDIIICQSPDFDGKKIYVLWRGADAFTLPEALYDKKNDAAAPAGLFTAKSIRGACGVMRKSLTLSPYESADECIFIGPSEGVQDGKEMLRRTRAYWRDRLSALHLYGEASAIDRMMNLWLPYQIRAGRLMARSGFYQSGGAYGFRDQLQDMAALLYTEPEKVRAHLLRCAAHQFTEGDVQHWWHEGKAGVRTHIKDDLLFLPYITAKYLRVTEDHSILSERVPFLLSPVLPPQKEDDYGTPHISEHTGTLHEHCLKALRYTRTGAHGLPLMGGGDWNDGMNRVGKGGGESVWLGFFSLVVMREYAPYCTKEEQAELQARSAALRTALSGAWTGQWFLRAWYGNGKPLGAPQSDVPRIDLISQAWAALADMPDMQVKTALDAAWEKLFDQKNGLVRLLSPAFSPDEPAGYIAAYAAGVRENGGQYTHAVPWMLQALIKTGQTERAWQMLCAVLPEHHADTKEKMRVYRVEPYVLCADVYDAKDHAGRGGWTWYTGSAAMLYTTLLEWFYGFEKRGLRVRLVPHLPKEQRNFTLLYRFGASLWRLVCDPDAPYCTQDGAVRYDGWAELCDDGKTHEARFTANKKTERF